MDKITINKLRDLLNKVNPPVEPNITVQSVVHDMLKILVGDDNPEGYNVEFTKLDLVNLIKAKRELIMNDNE